MFTLTANTTNYITFIINKRQIAEYFFYYYFNVCFVVLLSTNRYMPPVTPSTWKNTRLADHFSSVCPQTVPVADTGMEALLEMPRGRLAQLRRMKPLLANHSEDCLYLNMYVPREGKLNNV